MKKFNTFLDGKLAITGEYDNNIYASLPGFAKSVAIEFLGQVYVKIIDFEPDMEIKEMVNAFEDEIGANYFVNEILMGLPCRQILITRNGKMR